MTTHSRLIFHTRNQSQRKKTVTLSALSWLSISAQIATSWQAGMLSKREWGTRMESNDTNHPNDLRREWDNWAGQASRSGVGRGFPFA